MLGAELRISLEIDLGRKLICAIRATNLDVDVKDRPIGIRSWFDGLDRKRPICSHRKFPS